MNVLVTGVDGYVGALLGPMLMDRGHQVIGVDTGFYRGGWLYNGPTRFPLTVTMDVRQITADFLRDIDAAIHLAELSNDPLGALNPATTRVVNLQGTLDFARRCKSAGVQMFIYSSSCSVYGDNKDSATENTELSPLTEYAICKAKAEEGLAALADESFSPVIFRNATIYGPSPRMRFGLVVNRMAGMAWTAKHIEIPHDGANWRPLVHVNDVCRVMAHALEVPRQAVHNQVFNVASENHQVKAIAQEVRIAFPCQMTIDYSNRDERSYRVDSAKLRTYLPQFEYEHYLMAGLYELRQLFERIHLSATEFSRRPYTRLHQLQWLLDTRQVDDHLFWRKDCP